MPFKIVRNDITKMQTDAIVNAANSSLQMGGGVCGNIFSAAGADRLREECDKIGGCNVGKAVITSGYLLPSKYVIHTVGPVWKGGGHNERRLLYSCYTNSLILAMENGCASIAFPLISSGIYGYPKDKALETAVAAIGTFTLEHDILVYLVVFDKDSYTLSDKVFHHIEQYIDDNYTQTHLSPRAIHEYKEVLFDDVDFIEKDMCIIHKDIGKISRNLEDVILQLDESFSQMLLRLIDEKNRTDAEVYKKANIDRKLFSKIRSDICYKPSKVTAIAFAIALELSLDETKDLLCKAGFALSHSSRFDLIVEYFINKGIYNIFEINEALFAFDQTTLGA